MKIFKEKGYGYRTPSIVLHVNNILAFWIALDLHWYFQNIHYFFFFLLSPHPPLQGTIFKILYKSMDDVLCWEFQTLPDTDGKNY